MKIPENWRVTELNGDGEKVVATIEFIEPLEVVEEVLEVEVEIIEERVERKHYPNNGWLVVPQRQAEPAFPIGLIVVLLCVVGFGVWYLVTHP